MEQVIWRPVKGFEDRYEVSNDGQIRSLDTVLNCRGTGTRIHKGKILPQRTNCRGYITVNLCKDSRMYTKLVHRLVAEAFIDNESNKEQVNHIDRDVTNNAASNLEWVTDDENKEHSCIALGGTQRPKRRVVVTEIATGEVFAFSGLREAERALNIEHKSALNVISGKHKTTKGYTLSYV